MELFWNGERVDVPKGVRLMELLQEKTGGGKGVWGVAIAYNQELLPQNQWKEVTLQEGDRVEVVHGIQGG